MPGVLVEALVRQLVAARPDVATCSDDPAAGRSRPSEEGIRRVRLFDLRSGWCALRPGARTQHRPPDALRLSPREREVARMIAKGYPNKIIASVLDISVWTVSTHLRRIFAKLGVTSRTAMVTTMFKRGRL